MHCTELIGAAVEAPDTGPVLDAQARRSYELRIRELQAELVEAEDAHDQGGADKARLEMDWLVEQLLAATGHGGRPSVRAAATNAPGPRSAGGSGRRSRASPRLHPALGRHLRESVRTGAWCSYQPTSPVPWSSDAGRVRVRLPA